MLYLKIALTPSRKLAWLGLALDCKIEDVVKIIRDEDIR